MRNCILATILVVFFYGNLFAEDLATASKWTNEIAAVFEQDLRSGLDQPFYAEQLVGLEKDSVAQQISHRQAVCWVEALIRLAEEHSIELEDIFVGSARGLINADLIPEREVNRETADCARVAFSTVGIDYE